MRLQSEQGFTLLVFLTLLLMLSLLGVNAILVSTTEVDIAGYELNSTKATYAAEAGVELATARMLDFYNTYGTVPDSFPELTQTLGNQSINIVVSQPNPPANKTLKHGMYTGLYGNVNDLVLSSTASTPGVKAKTAIKVTMQAAELPIYQFAVYYDDDLEIAPGPDMTISGRVHTNGSLFLQASNSLTLDGYITATDNVHHGPSSQSGIGTTYGNVQIKDRDGNYQDMENVDGTWLDSDDADWLAESLDRWNGNLGDHEHGVESMGVPVVESGDARNMIRRGSESGDSFEHDAGLKLIDGQVYHLAADDSWNNVTADFLSLGILNAATFRDTREGVDVTSWDLDLGQLGSSSYWPDNGIIYSSNSVNSFDGLRLVNGQELNASITVASENPVYTLGDFNSTNKKSAAILSDAFSVLSGNWDDARSTDALDQRPASSTEVNVAYITGNVPSGHDGGTSYSGGYQNLPRLLEEWSGQTFTWTGSASNLWESEQATAEWSYGSYFTAPQRDWSFDESFLDSANLPPGTPMILVFRKIDWYQTTLHEKEFVDEG
jgi:hypothetical protein